MPREEKTMIVRPLEAVGGGAPSAEAVRAAIAEHFEGLGRLARLRAYYDGKHAICDRRRDRTAGPCTSAASGVAPLGRGCGSA